MKPVFFLILQVEWFSRQCHLLLWWWSRKPVPNHYFMQNIALITIRSKYFEFNSLSNFGTLEQGRRVSGWPVNYFFVINWFNIQFIQKKLLNIWIQLDFICYQLESGQSRFSIQTFSFFWIHNDFRYVPVNDDTYLFFKYFR